MKVAVCVKQTPSTTAVLRVGPDGRVSWDDPGGKPSVLNPWDEYAVEEAIRLQESHSAAAVAVTLGGEDSLEALRTCIAMGCADAVLVADSAFDGSDTLATARVLAAALRRLGDVSIALFGRQAIDGDTGQTAVQTARKLGWTPLTFVAHIKELDPAAGTITVERLLEEGKEVVTTRLPVVISVVKEINEPRYPSFMGIRKANRATIPTWTAADLSVEGATGAAASRADWSRVYGPPPRESSVAMITGDSVEEQVRQLVDRLFEEKVI